MITLEPASDMTELVKRVKTPWFKIEDLETREDGIRLLKKVEKRARKSHRSEDRITEDSWEKCVRRVCIERGDWSVAEHAHVTVEMFTDRGITHEIVRHRIGAYTQESTRFVNYEKKMPPSFLYPKAGSALDYDWLACIMACEHTYRLLLAKGWTPQEARSVLPNGLGSQIDVTYNLRNWRYFFLARTSREAHPQMRELVIPILKKFQELIPILYEDIQPEETQQHNFKQMR
jgi:thymidylate synthase (FAD)